MKDQDDEAFLNLLQPPPQAGESAKETAFSVDSLGIPILEDVVEQPTEMQPASAHPPRAAADAAQQLPDYETLLAAMREYLKSQLEDDLSRITQQVVPAAIANVTHKLAADIEREIQRLLEEKLSTLIERSLDHQLGKHDLKLD